MSILRTVTLLFPVLLLGLVKKLSNKEVTKSPKFIDTIRI
jgi:hypothetical protein